MPMAGYPLNFCRLVMRCSSAQHVQHAGVLLAGPIANTVRSRISRYVMRSERTAGHSGKSCNRRLARCDQRRVHTPVAPRQGTEWAFIYSRDFQRVHTQLAIRAHGTLRCSSHAQAANNIGSKNHIQRPNLVRILSRAVPTTIKQLGCKTRDQRVLQ